MTPMFHWKPIALIVCALMIASCAGSPPISRVAPPRLELPEAARRPCALATLPSEPTRADLEIAYAMRGAQIVSCDGARRLAVNAFDAERAMQEAQSPDAAAGGSWRSLWERLTRQGG